MRNALVFRGDYSLRRLIGGLVTVTGLGVLVVTENSWGSVLTAITCISAGACLLGLIALQSSVLAAGAALLSSNLTSPAFRTTTTGTCLFIALVFMSLSLRKSRNEGSASPGWISVITASLLVVMALFFVSTVRSAGAAGAALLMIVVAGATITQIPSAWSVSAGILLLISAAGLVLANAPAEANSIGAAAFYCLLVGALLAVLSPARAEKPRPHTGDGVGTP